MIALMIAAALISAAAAVFIVQRAAIAARKVPAEDPTLAVYRRQLSELDDLADHDLLPADERKAARAEAARRLLSAADETSSPLEGRTGLGLVIAVAAAAPLAAAAIYLLIGSPQIPDQPFKARLATWRASDPSTLDPAQMAAVLQTIVAERPADPMPRAFLARAEMAEGDTASAIYDFKKATKLAPNRADLWSALGEAQATSDDPDTAAEAHANFERASALDPKAPGPRYFLAREQIASGQVQAGVAAWKSLAADLQPNDPRRPELLRQIAQVQAGGAASAQAAQPQQEAQGGADQGAFIRAMVQRLADQLAAQPNDPQGWGRLIHAYGVLGDQDQRSAALAHAQTLFKDKPDAWAAVQHAAAGPS
jgi:cytochrome c-type biogenesis protein CcmH